MSSSCVFLAHSRDVFHCFDIEMFRLEKEKFQTVLPISRHARTVFDLLPEDMLKVEQRMRPGEWSCRGFLQKGDRLLSVCIADGLALLEAGVPCYIISGVASSILKEARKCTSREVLVAQKFKVTQLDIVVDGYQKSPFTAFEETPCCVGRFDYQITNVMNGKSIVVNKLMLEMIKQSFFFQTGPCRLDPKEAIECLDLNGGHYTAVIEMKAQYLNVKHRGQTNSMRYQEEKRAADRLSSPIHIAPGAVGYVLPYQSPEDHQSQNLSIEEEIRRKGENQGFSEENIEEKLDEYMEWENIHDPSRSREEILSQPLWREEKELFLHIFNDRSRNGSSAIQEIPGYTLSDPIRSKGLHIFALIPKLRVGLLPDVLDANDTSD